MNVECDRCVRLAAFAVRVPGRIEQYACPEDLPLIVERMIESVSKADSAQVTPL